MKIKEASNQRTTKLNLDLPRQGHCEKKMGGTSAHEEFDKDAKAGDLQLPGQIFVYGRMWV
jgi:hypothetical protein